VKPVLYFAIALALSALQSALLRWVGGGAIPVMVVMPMVVWLGLHASTVEGAVSALAVGYVLDLMNGGPKGLMTFLSVALYLFARGAGAAVDIPGRVGFAVLTFVGAFLAGCAALGLIDLVTPAVAAPGLSLVGRVALEAFVTALASPFIHALMVGVDRLFAREDPTLLR
jgi:rod shape-determining protein MreD